MELAAASRCFGIRTFARAALAEVGALLDSAERFSQGRTESLAEHSTGGIRDDALDPSDNANSLEKYVPESAASEIGFLLKILERFHEEH